ncbi:hypothetical protein Hanom_Chr09g00845261 [Helianthus anomalus]
MNLDLAKNSSLFFKHGINCHTWKSKLQKSSFMYAIYYKLCPLSLIFTRNVLDVCKLFHIMSFSPNSVSFYG